MPYTSGPYGIFCRSQSRDFHRKYGTRNQKYGIQPPPLNFYRKYGMRIAKTFARYRGHLGPKGPNDPCSRARDLGGQNLYTNTARRVSPQTPWRLVGVYVFSFFFPWKQAFWYTPNLFFACWDTWVFRAENTFGVYFFPSKENLNNADPKIWHANPPFLFRAAFWAGDEDSNFSVFRVRRFSEWPEPLHWIAFPVEILTKPLIHWIASPLFTENPFFSLKSASTHPLPKNRLWFMPYEPFYRGGGGGL